MSLLREEIQPPVLTFDCSSRDISSNRLFALAAALEADNLWFSKDWESLAASDSRSEICFSNSLTLQAYC